MGGVAIDISGDRFYSGPLYFSRKQFKEETVEYAIVAFIFLASILVCAGMFYVIEHRSSATDDFAGNIEIHDIPDDIDGPYMFLQLEIPVQELVRMKEAKLRIVVHKD